jgi:BASS family bile acid:Na+ symporter
LAHLQEWADAALPALLVVFMAGNLAAIGLELELRRALAPLRNLRFIVAVLAWDWIFSPGLAWLMATLVPMAEPYALGLKLIGLAPAAPFLPMMVRRAGGDMAYAAAFMLIAALGTVVFMPLALPLIAPTLEVTAWSIARPLIVLLLLPLVAGLALNAVLPGLAGRLRPAVKALADGATLGLLAAVILLYFDGFVGAIGSYAIATQFAFAIVVTVASYHSSIGLKRGQRRVVALGTCTRNLGAALAPLVDVTADPRATVMVALGIPITLIVTFVASYWFERHPLPSVAEPVAPADG